MRKATIELTLMNGSSWFLPEEELTSADITETPMAVVNQYLRGSRGPTVRVNSVEDMSGEDVYINVNMISEVRVSYN